MMVLQIREEPVPLRVSEDGKITYIGNTRVPLETVIDAYNDGDSPEQIVNQFPALNLANVYRIIAYYLEHQEEIDTYIAEAEAHNQQVRDENEAGFDTTTLRERLIAHKKQA